MEVGRIRVADIPANARTTGDATMTYRRIFGSVWIDRRISTFSGWITLTRVVSTT